jgi:KEOPS complex subunit Pcc1
MHSATLKLLSPQSDVVLGAISPEVGREIPRTRVKISSGPGQLVLDIEASDLAALRAALNSYLRWIKVAEDVSRTTGETNG